MINKNCPSSVSTRRQTKAGTTARPMVRHCSAQRADAGLHRSWQRASSEQHREQMKPW